VFDLEWLRKQVEPEIDKQGIPAAVALSALEQCAWDIAGKAFGVPAYQLFGGLIHSRIRNYANINRSTTDRSPDGFAAMATKAVGAGFDAIKMASWDGMPRKGSPEEVRQHTERGIACVEAVRRAIGPGRDLLVDAHSHFNLENGLALAKRLEPMNLFWLEEVTPARPPDDLAAINRAAAMRTAGGESIYGVKGFFPYIRAGAVDIAMPDVKYCGGMLELKKIAALAEAAGLPVSPHGPASPVGNLAAAHVSATMPNFLILEYAFGECAWREEVVDPPERLVAGHLTLTDRPGLGVALNKRTIERYRAS
jgi:galactonate dehydratase